MNRNNFLEGIKYGVGCTFGTVVGGIGTLIFMVGLVECMKKDKPVSKEEKKEEEVQ